MRSRADYEIALAVVREVVHSWDPYGLLRSGAPSDEFDAEIASLTAKIRHMVSEDAAIRAVADVFSSAFEKDGFEPADCADVGRRLYASLRDAGLLST